MQFCPKCGMRLPEGEEAKFCPNCGAPLSPQAGYKENAEIQVNTQKERKAGILSRRVTVLAIVLILVIMTTFIGTMSKIDRSEAESIVGEMDKLLETLSVGTIFGHNLMWTLIMFIPFLGTFWGFFVLYNTAIGFAAISLVYNVDPLLLFASLFVTPVFWLEYISYSLAISESLWLAYAAVRHSFKRELVTACKVIVICAVLLLLAAFVEMVMIAS